MKNILKFMPPEIKGGLIIVLAFTIIGPNDTLVPFIAAESGLWQFHFCRSIIAILLIVLFFKFTDYKITIYSYKSIAWRTSFYVISMLIYFGCLSFLPIAVTGAGMFTSPIFVLLFSAFIFKEHIGFKRICAVLVGSIGVWIILDPTEVNFSLVNLLPVLGGAFLAMGNMSTWRMCSNENALVLNMAFFLGIGLIGLVGTLFFSFYSIDPKNLIVPEFFIRGWTEGSSFLWGLIFIQAIVSVIGIGMLTKAYQMADTSYLNVFEYSFLIFAGLSAWFFLGQSLSLKTIFGILLIVIAGLIVSFAKDKINQHLNQ